MEYKIGDMVKVATKKHGTGNCSYPGCAYVNQEMLNYDGQIDEIRVAFHRGKYMAYHLKHLSYTWSECMLEPAEFDLARELNCKE